MYLPIDDTPKPPETVYTERAGSTIACPQLEGDLRADIAIVGGGIGGCSAALHAAEAGSNVVVLDASQVGWGAAGRNAGHVAPATKHDADDILKIYGVERGERLLDAVENGPRSLGELCKKHSIECDLVLNGIVSGAHTPRALKDFEKRAKFWQARGRNVRVLDRAQAAEMIGSDYFLGGFFEGRGGCINPLAFVRGLAAAAIRNGAQIFENSRAVGLRRNGTKWVISTADGTVTADCVFLCTNAYTDDLWPALRQTVVPIRLFQFMTEPQSEAVCKSILPGGQPMTDSRRRILAVRMHQNGRLHFGGLGDMFGPEGEPHGYSKVRIRKIFPQVEGLDQVKSWTGWIAMNSDDEWKLHELAPGLTTMIGCNGRGVALASTYGRELSRFAHGATADELLLPMTAPRPVPLRWLSQPGIKAIAAYWTFRDALEIRRLEKVNCRR